LWPPRSNQTIGSALICRFSRTAFFLIGRSSAQYFPELERRVAWFYYDLHKITQNTNLYIMLPLIVSVTEVNSHVVSSIHTAFDHRHAI